MSKYQGAIQWGSVKGGGYEWAVTRVSDGVNVPDATFATNWAGMKTAGVIRGAYQFFRPAQDPIQQADYFLSKLQQSGAIADGDLAPVLDVETVDGVSTADLRQRMQQWLDRMEQGTGRKPIIYTASFMSATVGTGFGNYPLWVANYGAACPTLPAGWNDWKMWQSADNGAVPGVSVAADVDVFSGTLADLTAFTHASHSPAGVGKHPHRDSLLADPSARAAEPSGSEGGGSVMGDGRPATPSSTTLPGAPCP